MKKIYLTIVLMLVVLASHAQRGVTSPMVGVWKQPTSSKINPNLTIEIIDNNFSTIINDGTGNKTVKFRMISSLVAVSIMPFEQQYIYGYYAKKTFLKFYNQGGKLRVVRILNEYQKDGSISNVVRLDSTLFEKQGAFDRPRPQPSQPEEVVIKTPLFTPIRQEYEIKTQGIKPVDLIAKPLVWAPSFNITDIQFETLFVDKDVNCAKAEYVEAAKTSEFFADLKLKIYKNSSQLQIDLGYIFLKSYSASNGGRYSYYPLELGKPIISTENYLKSFNVLQTDFLNATLRITGGLTEINPTIDGESGCSANDDKILDSSRNQFKAVLLKDLFIGKNYFDLKGAKNTLRIHFTITPN
jgi:hypothetical protein